MAYVRPQVTVDQNITIATTSLDRDQPAFIFGPNYKLYRYDNADEKQNTFLGKWKSSNNSSTFKFPNLVDASKVDENYTRLFGENVIYSKDGDITCTYDQGTFTVSDESNLNKLNKGDYVYVKYTSNKNTHSFITKIISTETQSKALEIKTEDSINAPDPSDITMTLCGINSVVEFDDGWSHNDEDLTINGLTINGKNVLSADLYATYRELSTEWADAPHSIEYASEVENNLGTVDPDNPLAMGVYMALLNSSSTCYFMATTSDDLDGYNSVMNKVTNTDKIYVLAPTTRDADVLKTVQDHVESMSDKDTKMWRIAIVSAEVPKKVSRLDTFKTWYATISDKAVTIVKSSTDASGNNDTKFMSTLVAGDEIEISINNSWKTYTIQTIDNNNTVTIDSPVSNNANNTYEIKIYHPYTRAEIPSVIASTSKKFDSRRMINVFPDHFTTDGVKMTGEFAACAVAGLISSTEPQQPITNMSVKGIGDIPLTYSDYSKSELDEIAAGGTLIVAQDFYADKVYVRHQITTAYSQDNLNAAELSITKNVDNISYKIADLFRPYYGQYNITNNLLLKFQNLLTTLINRLGSSVSKYGPQLILANTNINYVKQDTLLKDHVDISVTLGVPYPCNNIEIVLTV